MCIVCGGVCGGAGDVVLPAMVAGAGLVVLGVRARRQRAATNSGEPQSEDQSDVAAGLYDDDQRPSD